MTLMKLTKQQRALQKMSFKSQAQRDNALKKVSEGKMTQEQFDAYDKESLLSPTLPKKVPYSPKGLVRGPRKTR